jgi:hypothetical protein
MPGGEPSTASAAELDSFARLYHRVAWQAPGCQSGRFADARFLTGICHSLNVHEQLW